MSSSQAVTRMWFTPREVAEKFDVPYHQVMRMIYDDRLHAHKVGWMWVVEEYDLPEKWPPPRKT